MDEKERVSGNTTVAADVIETIIRQTAEETKGISRIFANSANNNGVRLKIINDQVDADVYICLEQRENAIEIGRKLQGKIVRAVSEMAGMEVGSINVHVEEFDYPQEG